MGHRLKHTRSHSSLFLDAAPWFGCIDLGFAPCCDDLIWLGLGDARIGREAAYAELVMVRPTREKLMKHILKATALAAGLVLSAPAAILAKSAPIPLCERSKIYG